MSTIKRLNKVNSIEELESMFCGLCYDIGHRGGGIYLYGGVVADILNIDASLLPGKIGAYCNYLGGGIRGAISVSTYNEKLTKKAAAWVDAFCEACRRAYVNAEADIFDAEADYWEIEATEGARRAGIVSAY